MEAYRELGYLDVWFLNPDTDEIAEGWPVGDLEGFVESMTIGSTGPGPVVVEDDLDG